MQKCHLHSVLAFLITDCHLLMLSFLFSVCKLTACDIDSMLGFMPGEVIGWIEKDGITGASSDEETAYANDQISEGVTVFVYCNNW